MNKPAPDAQDFVSVHIDTNVNGHNSRGILSLNKKKTWRNRNIYFINESLYAYSGQNNQLLQTTVMNKSTQQKS